MPDPPAQIAQWRRIITEEARRQEREGAHYAKKGFGHKFDARGNRIGEVVPGREGTGMMLIRDRVARRLINQGVPAYVKYAVTSQLGGRRVCAGRCSMPHGPDSGNRDGSPLPNALLHPTMFSWWRPKNLPAESQAVPGECCINVRHFDCLGFVCWCFWKALGPQFPSNLTHANVNQWRDWTEPISRTGGGLMAGDLLFDGSQHIGVVISPTEVAHAAGHRWGVQRTSATGPIYPRGIASWDEGTGGWDAMAGRPRIFGTP